MKQYYYANGDQQLGPFTFQELRSKNIKKETYIWYDGLGDWKRAGELPELNPLFESPLDQTYTNRPALPNDQARSYQQRQTSSSDPYRQQYNPPEGEKPKTWLVESIITTVACCFFGAIGGIAGIIAIIFSSQVDSRWAKGDAEGAQKASENAKLSLIIALVVGGLIFLLYLVALLSGAFY